MHSRKKKLKKLNFTKHGFEFIHDKELVQIKFKKKKCKKSNNKNEEYKISSGLGRVNLHKTGSICLIIDL